MLGDLPPLLGARTFYLGEPIGIIASPKHFCSSPSTSEQDVRPRGVSVLASSRREHGDRQESVVHESYYRESSRESSRFHSRVARYLYHPRWQPLSPQQVPLCERENQEVHGLLALQAMSAPSASR